MQLPVFFEVRVTMLSWVESNIDEWAQYARPDPPEVDTSQNRQEESTRQTKGVS